MKKRVRVVIIALSVLLTVSVLSLVATLLYHYFNPSGPTTVVVPNNLISPDSKIGSTSSGQTDEMPAGSDLPDSPEANAPGDANPGSDAASGTLNAPSYAAPSPSAGGQGETTAAAIYLHNRNQDDNTPFRVTNMFPGDSETKYFCVSVSHKGQVIVRYHADIRDGYEKLAEVLKCRVVLLTTGEELYDGLMRDMPKSLNHTLTGEADDELYYEITAYLDTSVGNDYQQKELIANFRWWVEEVEDLKPPKTGDTAVSVWVYVALMAVSLLAIVILCKKARKEVSEDAK